jgi:ribose transport system substrate-binding protein
MTHRKQRWPWMLFSLLLVALLAVSANAFAQDSAGGRGVDSGPITDVPDGSGLTVALAMGAVNSDFNVGTHDGALETLQAAGVEVLDSNAGGDVTRHIANIETAIEAGVDAIIIASANAAEMEAVTQRAADAGIPIVSLDIGLPGAVTDVTSDNHQLGIEMARYMLNAIGGEGRVVSFFAPGYRAVEIRNEMLTEVLRDYPNVEIISEVPYVWPDTVPDAKEKMETLLTANPEAGSIDAVWVPFDLVGVGAAQAIMEAGRGGEIVIVGADGDAVALETMAEEGSPFIATFAQDTFQMGRQSGIAAILAAQGAALPPRILVPTQLVAA